jgi:hypothetical protein
MMQESEPTRRLNKRVVDQISRGERMDKLLKGGWQYLSRSSLESQVEQGAQHLNSSSRLISKRGATKRCLLVCIYAIKDRISPKSQ